MKNKSAWAIAGLFGVFGAASFAFAGDAPASPHTFTANVNLVSDYYFRGITQTWHKPALQGGFDYTHANGAYAGVWSSNVSGNQYAGGSQEIDYYAGYNGKINDDLSYTAGFYGYYYPGANVKKIAGSTIDQTYDTQELNIGATFKWVSVKYSYSLSDYFGANKKTGLDKDSKGSSYLEVNLSYNLPEDLVLGGHIGRTDVNGKLASPLASGASNPDYTDYKVSLTKNFKDGWNVGLAYAKSTNRGYYDKTTSLTNTDMSDLGKGNFILSAGRTF